MQISQVLQALGQFATGIAPRSRAIRPLEIDLAHRFTGRMGNPTEAWTRMIQTLLASAEFRYVN